MEVAGQIQAVNNLRTKFNNWVQKSYCPETEQISSQQALLQGSRSNTTTNTYNRYIGYQPDFEGPYARGPATQYQSPNGGHGYTMSSNRNPWKELQAQDRNREDMDIGLEIGPGTGTVGHFSTSSSGLISSCAQGSGFDERRGKRIWITRVDFWGRIRRHLYLSNVATGNANIYVALVLDTQTNGALFNTEDVYSAGTPELNEVPRRNLACTQRFRVLKHIRIEPEPNPGVFIVPTASVQYPTRDWSFSMHVEFKNPIVVSFDPDETGGEIANVVDNSIHAVLFTSNSTGPLTGSLTASFISRMRFYS